MLFLFQGIVFSFHVSFLGCILNEIPHHHTFFKATSAHFFWNLAGSRTNWPESLGEWSVSPPFQASIGCHGDFPLKGMNFKTYLQLCGTVYTISPRNHAIYIQYIYIQTNVACSNLRCKIMSNHQQPTTGPRGGNFLAPLEISNAMTLNESLPTRVESIWNCSPKNTRSSIWTGFC